MININKLNLWNYLKLIIYYLNFKSFNILIKKPLMLRFNIYKNGSYNIKYYPSLIALERNKIKEKEIVKLSWENFNNLFKYDYKKNKSHDFFFNKKTINELWFNKKKHELIDEELYNASHRFKWLLFDLEKKFNRTICNKNFNLIKKWCDNFKNPDQSIAWHPYNVSERICNLIIFFNYQNTLIGPNNDIDIFIKTLINTHTYYLLDNLEYPASKIVNNHILNNSRALYFISIFTNNDRILLFSKILIKQNLPKMLSKNYVLNEASTHYHFLATMWMLEIYLMSQKKNDKDFTNFMKVNVNKMLKMCDFFQFSNNIKLDIIPKIGDVSPDMPINWFNLRSKKKYGWINIWNFKNKNKVYNKTNILKDGWLKLHCYNWLILSYSHPNKSVYPYGHGHDDFASFTLYLNSLPILIDIGLFSYNTSKENSENGKLAEDHSIFTINGEHLLRSGSGYKSPISSMSRKLSNFRLKEKYIKFEGKTLNNKKWKRDVIINNKKSLSIIDQCYNDKKHELEGWFYLSKELTLVSKKGNLLLFSSNKKIVSFLFDKDTKIKIQKKFSYDHYGLKSEINCINYKKYNFMRLNIEYLS